MDTQNAMNAVTENLKTMIKFGQIWAEGFSDISKNFAHMAQGHMEANLAVMKAMTNANMTNAKSSEDALDIQTDHVKASLDKSACDAKSLTESTSKLARETMMSIKPQAESSNGKHRAA